MAEKAAATTKALEAKQTCPNSCEQKPGLNSSGSSAGRILQLQRTAGNRAVQKLIKSRALQAKLRVGQPNDIYEQEADRVAEQVMRMPEPKVSNETRVSNPARNNLIQRKCPGCKKGTRIKKEEEDEKLQKKEASGSTPKVTQELESSISAVRGGGKHLPESARTFFEPRFGADFSGVRVHTGSQAAETAKSINARAFTIGENIVFGEGQYAPDSQEGRRLIAHELTHTVQQRGSVQRKSVPDIQKKEEHLNYNFTYLFKEIIFFGFELQEKTLTTITSNPDADTLIKQGLNKVFYFEGGEPVYETPTFLKTDLVKSLIKADIEAWSGTGVPVFTQLDKLISKRSKALHSTFFMEKVNNHLKTIYAIDPSFIDWNLLIPQLKANVFTWVAKEALEASQFDQYEWVLDLLAEEAKGFEPVVGARSFDPATINNYLYPFIVNNEALFSQEVIKEHSEKFVMPWLVKISKIKYVPDNFSIKAFEPGEDIKKAERTRKKLLDEFIQNEVPDLMFKFVLDQWTGSGVNPDIWLKKLNIDSYKEALLEHLSETFLQKAKQDPEYLQVLRLEAVEKTKFNIIKMFYSAAMNMQTTNASLEQQFRKGYKENLDKNLVAIIENPAEYFDLSVNIASATASFLNSIQPDRSILNDILVSIMDTLKAMQIPEKLSALLIFFGTLGNYLKEFKATVEGEKAKAKEAIKSRINVDYASIAKVIKNWQKVAEDFMEKKFKPMLKKVALEWLAANKKEIKSILDNYDPANAKYAKQMNDSATELEYIAEGLANDEYEEVEYQGEVVTKNDLPHLRITIQFMRDEANARLSTKSAEKEKGKLREALDVYEEVKQDVVNDEFDWLDYKKEIFIEARRRLGISEFPEFTTYRDIFTGRAVAEKSPFLAMVIQNYYWKEDTERKMSQVFKIVGLGILTIGAMFVPGVGGSVLGAIDISVGIGMGVKGVVDAKEVVRMAKLDIHGTIRGVSIEQAEEALKHAWFGLILTVVLTVGPIAISRLKVRGKGGVLLSKETQAWERTLTKETKLQFRRDPALRRRFATMSPTARRLLTHCSRLCVPPGLTDGDVARIENLAARMERDPRGYSTADEWMLREYFYARQSTIGTAIADVEGVANLAQLRTSLRRASSQRALGMPVPGGPVGPSGYPGAWGNIRRRGPDPNYGHSVDEHGPELEAWNLMDRARDPKRNEDVGQWYDNSFIIDAEQRATSGTIIKTLPNGKTIHEFDMGRAVGRVFTPNGTIVSDVTRVRVVRFANGRLDTSFPMR